MTSHLDTTRRRLFELRFERRASGEDGTRHHPASRPVGIWSILTGRDAGTLVSLHGWDSLMQREEIFGRPREPGSPIPNVESWILVDSPAADGLATRHDAGGLHEMRLQKALNGSTREAAEALATVELPAAIARGAKLLGLYELAVGPHRPLLVSFLSWPAGVSPDRAWADIDTSAIVAERRTAERRRHGRRLFAELEQSLLQPVRRSAQSPTSL